VQKLAIIGAGITGLSAAQLLQNSYKVKLFEKISSNGGLIRCDRIKDNLFHRVGGHVFNSKNSTVLNWFWSFFNRDEEFLKARRNAKIWMQGRLIGYPLENHLFQLDSKTVASILQDLLDIQAAGPRKQPEEYPHFEAFLRGNFGNSLYSLYFGPYNEKIWNTDLSKVPLGWLDGKLPMPNINQILLSNIIKQEECTMVHSIFYYPIEKGSQFIVDRLAEGLNINNSTPILSIAKSMGGGWLVNNQTFDKVIYTGDVRMLEYILHEADPALATAAAAVRDLPSNGTSNLFCETDPTDISWLYLPDGDTRAHRIIYTGTFAPSNNRGSNRMTCVVEFSGKRDRAYMEEQVNKLPGNLNALDYNYEPNSYVLQRPDTRSKIYELKRLLEPQGFFLAGRFAEWEYYNMDKAIEAAMAVASKLQG